MARRSAGSASRVRVSFGSFGPRPAGITMFALHHRPSAEKCDGQTRRPRILPQPSGFLPPLRGFSGDATEAEPGRIREYELEVGGHAASQEHPPERPIEPGPDAPE